MTSNPADRQRALDESLAMYLDPGPNERWYHQAAALLIAAGADEEAARAIRGSASSGLGGLGEQGGAPSG
jgi:hypothetical protein